MPSHQEPGFAVFRGLVALNLELAKGSEGNPLSIDNHEVLKEQSLKRIKEAADITEGAKKMIPKPLLGSSGCGLVYENGAPLWVRTAVAAYRR